MSDLGSCPSAAGVTGMGAVRHVYVLAVENPVLTARRVGRCENRGGAAGAGGATPDVMRCLSLTTKHMARNPRLMWCSSMTTKLQARYPSCLRVQITMRTRDHYPLVRNPIFSGDPKMEKLFAI